VTQTQTKLQQDLLDYVNARECQKRDARFEEAIRMTEEAFLSELGQLVGNLRGRLAGDQDGRPKVFRDTTVTNLAKFFGRFKSLNVNSSEQLNQLVEEAQQLIGGVQPQMLREDLNLRQRIGESLGSLQESLDELLVDRPRRNIVRRPK